MVEGKKYKLFSFSLNRFAMLAMSDSLLIDRIDWDYFNEFLSVYLLKGSGFLPSLIFDLFSLVTTLLIGDFGGFL